MLFENLSENQLNILITKENLAERMRQALTDSQTIDHEELAIPKLLAQSRSVAALLNESSIFLQTAKNAEQIPSLDKQSREELTQMQNTISTLHQSLSENTLELRNTAARVTTSTSRLGVFGLSFSANAARQTHYSQVSAKA